jgi:hypothetical protein
MASFPTSVHSFTTKATSDTIQAAHVNDAQDEITAIETAILTDGFSTPGLTVTTDPITLTSGQIAFPATQLASGGANTLDDYEEGTWTPVIKSDGGAGDATYTTQQGVYVKVGKHVTFGCRIVLATVGTLPAGNLYIQPLPYAAANLFIPGGAECVMWNSLGTAVIRITGLVTTSDVTFSLRKVTAATTSAPTALLDSDLSGTDDLYFWGSYISAN